MADGLTIELSGDIQKALQDATQEVLLKIEDSFKEFAVNMERDAKSYAPVDEGTLRANIKAEAQGLGAAVVVNVNYAAYLEFGTRGYAAKYVASLPPDWQSFALQFKGKTGGGIDKMLLAVMDWVKRKGFAAELTKSGNSSKSKSSIAAQENAAYVIALRILQNGIKPHPYLYPAFEKNFPLLEADIRKALNI